MAGVTGGGLCTLLVLLGMAMGGSTSIGACGSGFRAFVTGDGVRALGFNSGFWALGRGEGVRALAGTRVRWLGEGSLFREVTTDFFVGGKLIGLVLDFSNMFIKDVVGGIEERSKGWSELLEELLLFNGEGDLCVLPTSFAALC